MQKLSSAWHQFTALAISGIFMAIIVTMILLPRDAVSEVTAGPLSGWLWSDTIGWISLNCADAGTCSTAQYSVQLSGNGDLSGYGWSDSVGWITFNASQLSGCPSGQAGNGSCPPKITNGTAKGWIRACAGMNDTSLNQTMSNNTCTNAAGSRTDGWDGWISLNGTSPISYGPTADGVTGEITGYAWGSEVQGWLEFDADATYSCTPEPSYCENSTTLCAYDTNTCAFGCTPCAYQCSSGACISPTPTCDISASPKLVATGASTTISWSSSNTGDIGCTVSGNGNNWSGLTGSELSNPINGQTTYTQTCTGPDDTSTCTETTTINPSPEFREI